MEHVSSNAVGMLKELVSRSGWHSSDVHFLEALPHMSEKLEVDELIETLHNLEIPIRIVPGRLDRVQPDDCPALFVDHFGKAVAVLDVRPSRLLLLDPHADEPQWTIVEQRKGTLIRLEKYAAVTDSPAAENFNQVVSEHASVVPWLMIATFFANVMALFTPLLIMFIYDRVIPSGSQSLLIPLLCALGIIIASEAIFRFARTKALAHVGREIEGRMGVALFRKLLVLPSDQFQKADVEKQVARFKQFEGLRDVFTGPILTTLTDLPFTLIFCAVLFLISPQVGWLVAALMVVFAIATVVTLPKQKAFDQAAAREKSELQNHVFETIKNQQSIRRLGLIDHWDGQSSRHIQESASATRKAQNYKLVVQSAGQGLMTVAGLGAVYLSTVSAIAGDMSFGQLIAVMSLVWKTLSPLQSLFSNASQIASFLSSRTQFDQVLGLPEEVVRGAAQSHQKHFDGHISFVGVTHRYAGAATYALSQVSLSIDPGECVLLGGGNSSGKTTFANLITKLYQPLAGSIHLDRIDIRQIAIDDLRRAITYVQPTPEFFYGTIHQNFRLAAPAITEAQVERTLDDLNLLYTIRQLPDGIHTRLTEAFRADLPDATLRGLSLARGLARESPVTVLYEPNAGLDDEVKSGLAHTLRAAKGKRTFIIASLDPVHMEIADRFVFLDQGRVVLNDSTSAGYKKFTTLSNKFKVHNSV